jgi:hypothetical protein
MPKKVVKKTKAQQDAETLREIQNLERSLGIDRPPVGGPGANDQELYPTDRGHTDFRLAKGKKKKRGGQSYA